MKAAIGMMSTKILKYLHGAHVVSVVANDPRQLDFPYLIQLLHGEGARPAPILVPVAIAKSYVERQRVNPTSASLTMTALPEVVELLPDEAGERRADHRSG